MLDEFIVEWQEVCLRGENIILISTHIFTCNSFPQQMRQSELWSKERYRFFCRAVVSDVVLRPPTTNVDHTLQVRVGEKIKA